MSTSFTMQTNQLQSTDQQVTATEFRDAMSQIGAAVHIVTTDGACGRAGFAASAICSVTDTPPTMLVCLQRKSSAYAAAVGNGVVCINTLQSEHENLSRIFSGKTSMAQRFESAEWSTLATGAPVLSGSRLSLDCELTRIVQIGTHDVLFCQVKAVISNCQGTGGLYYLDRGYHRLFTPPIQL